MFLLRKKKLLDFRILKKVYAQYNLSEPAIMQWPLCTHDEAVRIIHETRFRQTLSKNLPPGLLWMQKHANTKYRPDNILHGCRTILVSHLGYYRQDKEDNLNDTMRRNKGRIARYARGRDYHKELGIRLKKISRLLTESFPEEQFKSYTDTGPLDEVWLAEASGAGFRGRNGLTIFQKTGSWAVIGHVLSTAIMEDYSNRSSPRTCPDGCNRCIEACPTRALKFPGILEKSRCISYQSIEHKGTIDVSLRPSFQSWIFGCDICQEVCPFNCRTKETDVKAFKEDRAGASLDLVELLTMKTRQQFIKRFSGSPLMRPGLTGMIRNACIVAGNSGNPDIIPLLKPHTKSEDGGVREHAAWAIEQLTNIKNKSFTG